MGGGLWKTVDGGENWSPVTDGQIKSSSVGTAPAWTPQDFATPQYYPVVTTKHVPYHVCGAQQDGSTVCLPGNSPSPLYGQGGAPPVEGRGGRGAGFAGFGGGRAGAIQAPYSAGGSEPGYIAPDPKDPDVIFAGGNNGTFLTRMNRKTGHVREVNPEPRIYSGEPAGTLEARWQWTYPIVFSPVDPNVLYTSSQYVYKTSNGGQTWDRISGDLTRHDPKTLGHSGGPITGDMNGPEIYQVRNRSGQDPLNFPIKTNNRLAGLLRAVNFGDGKPIGNAPAIFDDLVAELKGHTDRLQQVIAADLMAFNAEAKRLKLEPIGASAGTAESR